MLRELFQLNRVFQTCIHNLEEIQIALDFLHADSNLRLGVGASACAKFADAAAWVTIQPYTQPSWARVAFRSSATSSRFLPDGTTGTDAPVRVCEKKPVPPGQRNDRRDQPQKRNLRLPAVLNIGEVSCSSIVVEHGWQP